MKRNNEHDYEIFVKMKKASPVLQVFYNLQNHHLCYGYFTIYESITCATVI